VLDSQSIFEVGAPFSCSQGYVKPLVDPYTYQNKSLFFGDKVRARAFVYVYQSRIQPFFFIKKMEKMKHFIALFGNILGACELFSKMTWLGFLKTDLCKLL